MLFQYVWGGLLASVVVCCRLLASHDPWRGLGVSGGCLVGVWVFPSGIHGNRRQSDVFEGYLGSQALQYGATTLFWHSPEGHDLFSSDNSETSKYQNVYI